MKCIVCKISKEKGEGRQRWVFSSERVPIARTQILFKLYDLTKKELPAGSICPVCFDLLAQIDSLECQMSEVLKTLKSRINCCATAEDYMAAQLNDADDDFYIDDDDEGGQANNDDDDIYEDGDVRALQKPKQQQGPVRVRKRPSLKQHLSAAKKSASSSSSYLKMRVKREKPDYVEGDGLARGGNHSGGANSDDDDSENGGDEDDLDMSRYLSVEHIKKEEGDDRQHDMSGPSGDSSSRERKSSSSAAIHHEPNRSAENLDFNLTVTRTTRGHDQLVYENYTYLKTTHQPANDIARWKCTSYYATKTGCRAKLHTTMDGACVLLDSKTEHNHPPPDERQLKIILFREQVKQIANNHPEMKPTEILTNAQMLLDTPTALGIKDVSIMRYIQRVKSKSRQERQQQQQQMVGQVTLPLLSQNIQQMKPDSEEAEDLIGEEVSRARSPVVMS